jgi:RIO kinase 2
MIASFPSCAGFVQEKRISSVSLRRVAGNRNVTMVKLDPSILRYLNREHMRVLTCVEMGMKNHDLVPTQLINTIAQLKHGGAHKALGVLHKYKLVYHERKQCSYSQISRRANSSSLV